MTSQKLDVLCNIAGIVFAYSCLALTLGRTRTGSRVDATPLRIVSYVLKTIFCQLISSLVAVCLSLRHILVKFGDNRLL